MLTHNFEVVEMGVPYGYDLRMRVIEQVDLGVRIRDIAATFSIHIRTIYSWLNQREITENFYPPVGRRERSDRKIKDLRAFKEFVVKNPNRTVKEMADDYGGISESTAYRTLIKIGFTSKKNKRTLQRKQVRGTQCLQKKGSCNIQ